MTVVGSSFGMDVRGEGRWLVTRVHGDLDVNTSPALREALFAAVDDGQHALVLDLSGLAFIDSTGLGVLVAVMKQARTRGGDLVLRRPTAAVMRVLELTGLDQVSTIEV